ncbi:MAG: esterase-like activity of phytase family protein [Polymorphobacter sp.]
MIWKNRYYLLPLTAALLIGGVAIALVPPDVTATKSVAVTATAIPLNPADPSQTQVGRLKFMGALALKSGDESFGGISGLRAGVDGRMLAVTDTGNWLSFVTVERDGRLVGITDVVMAPIRDAEGQAAPSKTDGDAEALSWDPVSGAAVVAFEQDHRLQYYRGIDPARPETLTVAASKVTRTPRTAAWADNAGGEVLASLADGTLVVIGEDPQDGYGRHDILLIDDKQVRRLGYTAPRGTRPTDAILLSAPATLLVVNRSYSPLGGVTAVLETLDLDALAALPDTGSPTSAQAVVARLAVPLSVDNMEGIALRRTAGRTFVYLVSDDNFNPVQRTLLFKFELLQQ